MHSLKNKQTDAVVNVTAVKLVTETKTNSV